MTARNKSRRPKRDLPTESAPKADKQSTTSSFRGRWSLIGAVIVSVAIGWTFTSRHHTVPLSEWQTRISQTSGLNARPTRAAPGRVGGYVGAQACRDCHTERYDGFQRTLHAKSMSTAERLTETQSTSFAHALSSRKFKVANVDNEHWHEEELESQGTSLARTRKRMDFAIGSGQYGITPVYRQNEYLMQSPLTWYRESGQWELSPGYDKAHHFSFQRPVTGECLFCHAGQAVAAENGPLQIGFPELAIGCERCHGPGQRHVNLHASKDDVQATDSLIVHPGKLDRETSEAICQQCHLQTADFQNAAGASVWDYQPGDPLWKNRTDFQLSNKPTHKLVGHVEQLHRSLCYTQSETLTCVTCHDPHHRDSPSESTIVQRDACLSCHVNESCGVQLETRRTENDNACANCHMPKMETDVVHVALHHHTIAIPSSNTGAQSLNPESSIEPVVDQGGLDQEELRRREDLSILELALRDSESEIGDEQILQAYQRLLRGFEAGTADAQTLVQLSCFGRESNNRQLAEGAARRILKEVSQQSPAYTVALDVLAGQRFQAGDNASALDYYGRLCDRRAISTDHYFLAMCLLNAGRNGEAIASAEYALRLQPDMLPAHEFLAITLRGVDEDRADLHTRMVQELRRIEPSLSVAP